MMRRNSLKMSKTTWQIGIDEAGRGPLAGPLALGVVLANDETLAHLNLNTDSKGLSAKKRAEWYEKIMAEEKLGNLFYVCILISNLQIDKLGLTACLKQAISEALKKLPFAGKNYEIFLDGGLRAGSEYKNQQTIIGGDKKVRVISLASIVAKVTRDKHMIRLAKKYPRYGFEIHKGYATADHYLALLQYGSCSIHRQRFLGFLTP